MSKNLSIIVRVKNEEQHIGYCLQSICDFLPNSEIIVINNNSKDRSIEIINHFKKNNKLQSSNQNYLNIKVYNIDNYTPGKALNLGVKKSSSSYIMIISSHCRITRLNFETIEKNLLTYSAIFGKQIPIWFGKRIQPRYVWSNFSDEQKVNMYSEYEKRYFFHNAFSFFLKKTLVDNPFDEDLVGKEDRYWCKDIINLNKNILYNPDLIVEHFFTNNGNTWKSL